MEYARFNRGQSISMAKYSFELKKKIAGEYLTGKMALLNQQRHMMLKVAVKSGIGFATLKA